MKKPNWQMIVDEATGMKFSAFYPTKSGIVDDTSKKLRLYEKAAKKEIKFWRQDNAGENKILMQNMQGENWQFGCQFEFTAKETPQQNALAELGFTVIAARSRALMNHACVPRDMRYKLWPECAVTATKLDWLSIVELNGVKKTRVEHYQNLMPNFVQHLRTWGEAGTVKTGKDGKVGDRGVTMIFIGYANSHEGDCYRMLNPITSRVTETRDVIWLRRMYYEQANTAQTRKEPIVALEVTRESDQDGVTEVQPAAEEAKNADAEKSDESSKEDTDDRSVTSEASEESSTSAKVPEVRTRTGRLIQHTRYEPETGRTVKFSLVEVGAVQNYHDCLAELDKEEF